MPDAPRRIQLSRRKGYRMPPNTVKVDRATQFASRPDTITSAASKSLTRAWPAGCRIEPMKKKYSLPPEHRAQMRPWAQKWIANAMSTKPMDASDKAAMKEAVVGLYEAANLPPPKNIVFVPSPLVGNVTAGLAAAIWWLRHAETYAATYDATHEATDEGWVVHLSVKFLGAKAAFGISCVRRAHAMRSAGNHWSGWAAFLSFFRHVAKLDLPTYDKWRHYESATIHGSWRWMHPKFCIVSDRPCVLKMDAQNRPHCADGPSHEWRDGWKLYHWHGIRVPDHFVEERLQITPAQIKGEKNAEHRRILTEIYASIHGPGAIIQAMGARLISEDKNHGQPRRIYDVDGARYLHVVNGSLEPDGSRREFWLGAESDATTPHDAVAASYGRPAKKYREAVRT